MEKFRREDDFGILVQAAGEVHREAAGAGGHSRRAGGQSQPRFLGRSNYLLNELGIALIYPNVRGSTGYGKTFSLLDNGFKRDDTYKDINALIARGRWDGGRVGVNKGLSADMCRRFAPRSKSLECQANRI